VARRPLERERVCLDGGRRTTQLMRDSLGSRDTALHYTSMRSLTVFLCLMRLVSPLAAQCVPQQAAQLYHEAISLLARTDSESVGTRWVWDLPRIDSSHIRIVTDTALCRKAALSYVKFEGMPEDSSEKPLAAEFAVVQADSLLLMEHASTAGHRGCCWIVLVVDLEGKRRFEYSGGL
jgi:hypothetical protein